MANTSFENLKSRQAAIAPESVKKMSSFDALKARQKLIGSEPAQTEQPEEKNSFLGNLIKAPLTIAARPFQAIAELGGASAESVDKVTKKLTGGLVAPVPQNSSDVKKDVGRGAQTVALGLGPVSGGAAFGLGNSLEQGNDLFSTQTALQTGLGAGGGKLLDVLGKPLLNVASKGLTKITPQAVEDIVSKGAGAVDDFMKSHQILPKNLSQTISTGAEKLETGFNKPFEVAGNATKSILPKSEDIMNRVARLPPSDANKFKEMTGISHGEYLSRTGNFNNPEDIVKNEFAKFQASKAEADTAFSQIPGQFRDKEIRNALGDLLEREERIGISGKDSGTIKSLSNKYESDGLSMDEINEVKRLYERNVRLNYAKDIRANPDIVERANRVDSDLRNWQLREAEKRGLKNLGDINKQTQASKFIVDKLGKQLTGKSGNDLIPLSDLIVLSGGNIQNIAGYLAKRGFASKTFQAKLASILNSEEVLPFIKAEIGQSSILGLPAPKTIELPGGKGTTIYEAPAQKIRKNSVPQLQLPAGNRNAINGPTIRLPQSIRETNLGLDEVRNLSNYDGLYQPAKPQITTKATIKNNVIKNKLPNKPPKLK